MGFGSEASIGLASFLHALVMGILVRNHLLPEIKLNLIHPLDAGAANQITHSQDNHKAINCYVAYEALSYSWGAEGSVENITVNDRSLDVTKNLADALFFLRDESSTRTLWIDALCINQADLVEKGTRSGTCTGFTSMPIKFSYGWACHLKIVIWP